MSDRCPLVGQVWEDQIPEFCQEHCGHLWDEAEVTTPIEDLLSEDCTHDLEFGGATLARGNGRQRFWTILNTCVETGDDILNETYIFDCPKQ